MIVGNFILVGGLGTGGGGSQYLYDYKPQAQSALSLRATAVSAAPVVAGGIGAGFYPPLAEPSAAANLAADGRSAVNLTARPLSALEE
jgi:hypothetical protein